MPIKEYKFKDLTKFWQFISLGGELTQEMGELRIPFFEGKERFRGQYPHQHFASQLLINTKGRELFTIIPTM